METTKHFAFGEIVPLEASKSTAHPSLRRVTLQVKTFVESKRVAARLARDYAQQDLEAVLAAFVEDLATAADRPGSWESEKVTAWLSSHPWPRSEKEDDLCP